MPHFPTWKLLLGSEGFWEGLSWTLPCLGLDQNLSAWSKSISPSGINNARTSICSPKRTSRWKAANNWPGTLYEGLCTRKTIQGLGPGLCSPRKTSWNTVPRVLSPGNFDRLCCCGCWVTQSCPTLCDPMDCNTPDSSVLRFLPEFAQIHIHWVGDLTISSSATPFSFCLQSFPSSSSFPMSQFFTSGGQSIGALASASVLPMNIQGWFPLGLTGLVGLVVFMTLSQLLTEPQIVRAGEDLRTSVETVVPQSLATDKVACRCTWFGYVTFWEICNRSTAFRTRKIFSFFFFL